MSDNDGGPAFPAPLEWQESCSKCGEYRSGVYDNGNDGMSLRDYFAGQALAGMTGGGWRPGSDEARQTLARDAYRVADFMLAARKDGTK